MTDLTPPKAESAPLSASVTTPVNDNHVYFYQDVDSANLLTMIRQLREVDATLRAARANYSLPADWPMTPIWLHVQSYGGGLLEAFGAVDQIKAIKSPVYSVIEGYACSAATLIAAACSKRYITPNSYMLIHQFTSVLWGTYQKFQDDMLMQDMLMKQMIEFYAAHSTLKKRDIRKMLKHDCWLNAEQVVACGLAELITQSS